MPESRRKFDQEFKEGGPTGSGDWAADRVIAKDLGINAGTLSNWMALDRRGKDGTGRQDAMAGFILVQRARVRGAVRGGV